MRVVCDKCDGEGVLPRNDGSGLGIVEDTCPDCKGEGILYAMVTLEDILVAQALRKGEIAGLVPHLVDVETGQLWLMKSYAQLCEEGKKCFTENETQASKL